MPYSGVDFGSYNQSYESLNAGQNAWLEDFYDHAKFDYRSQITAECSTLFGVQAQIDPDGYTHGGFHLCVKVIFEADVKGQQIPPVLYRASVPEYGVDPVERHLTEVATHLYGDMYTITGASDTVIYSYVAKHTKIPVPHMFAHGSKGVKDSPYMIMEYVEGKRLTHSDWECTLESTTSSCL